MQGVGRLRLESSPPADLLRGSYPAEDSLARDQAAHDEDYEEVFFAEIAATSGGCFSFLNYAEAVIAGEVVKEK